MNLRTLLTLGRTSNLPTVWSNMLAGAVLGGAVFGPRAYAVLALAGSAFYEGGMFLNDAFDADIDARERPQRPIPSGQVTRGAVYVLGFGLLFAGLLLLAAGSAVGAIRPGFSPFLGGVGTAAAVLAYNRWHKGHAWSPVVMGACRAGLYLTAALAVSGKLSPPVLLGAGALWLYIVGLTHIARFENGSALQRTWVAAFVLSPLLASAPQIIEQRSGLAALCFLALLGWSLRSIGFALRGGKGQIPRAVVTLIAGASLVDALFIALYGPAYGVLAAFGCFLLTLRWQRRIPGT
ncbi:MAG: prenyltransferase [Myxococcales bacterium]|nr:MAG: prenyltransferase [Myxococcales bacterium]